MDIGARMKENYEKPSRHTLVRRMPVIIRVDGRAFHTYTKTFEKPFSSGIMSGMVSAAKYTSEDMQGFKAAYIQSDEASFLLTDYDTHQTEPWFGYVKSKLESITASLFTAEFNLFIWQNHSRNLTATFDARAFNIPREEVVNYFLWRAKDWERNSVAMYCGAHFSHKEMHGMGRADQHEMLHRIGLNWTTDLPDVARNGTFLIKDTVRQDILPTYGDIDAVLGNLINCDMQGAT
jgi:tRNA(His) 5'-end guanylyltransferase